MAWPEDYFFDTTEHLNLKGKLRRSDLIAERLLQLLRAQTEARSAAASSVKAMDAKQP